MKKTLIALSFVLSFAAFVAMPHGAHALTLTPPKIEVAGDPGETVTAVMTVINDSGKAAVYYSSFANFASQGESGTPAIVTADDDLGTWITVPESITLAPGAARDITVSIAIPKNAAPGGHFAAVFWGTQPNAPVKKQTGIGAKTGSLVLLRVNGDIPESGGVIEFDTVGGDHFFTALPIPFYYRFQNGGGDRINPKGDIVMKDMLFITGARVPGNPVDGNILPNSTRKFTTVWAGKAGAEGVPPSGFFKAVKYEFKNFAFGRYAAHLKLSYGTKGEVTDSVVHVWVFPWHLTLFVIVLAALIWFLSRMGVRHFEHWAIEEAEVMLEKKEEAKEELAREQAASPASVVPAPEQTP
jgi:hypothetical protein